MTDIVVAVVSAIGGGVMTGFFNVWQAKLKNQGSNESVYADHTKELFERLDQITQERDDLKDQVNDLQLKIDYQSNIIEKQGKTIDALNKQMGELNSKFDLWEES
ncbi:phage scaffolding protein [Companilactobacillus allii]|uniref:Uncharacterized protein n=1 Tax=Companilactobacillus allii TaxID=1847728 RepID=A0A1P8Q2L5_9LACO|nr:hypothetical protein [Companilactobacillus allii]APX72098.1 hypothetical protein BTM29_05755 [Companilactobacillus allii]USQ69190.1 phage scaffolding protein [Companilactobacillus allii]